MDFFLLYNEASWKIFGENIYHSILKIFFSLNSCTIFFFLSLNVIIRHVSFSTFIHIHSSNLETNLKA